MRDIGLVLFLATLLALALKRPFLFVLAYVYVDTVSPQRLSYYLLNSIPLSMIVAILAFAAWALFDRKDNLRVSARQILLGILLVYCGVSTLHADFPVEAAEKWDYAWKALAFAIFLPFTLRTRLRIEAVLLFLTLSAASIIITGGIKTAVSGGGYGVLNLMVDNNSGLYESSIISTVAVALVPIILWFARYGTIYPARAEPVANAPGAHSPRQGLPVPLLVKLFCGALILACLLIPVGTEARTGLVCIGVLGILLLRDLKRRILYIGAVGLLGLAAVPFLPSSFTTRMETIQGYQADASASTRLAVWAWTLEFVQERPLGGGFGAYRQNRIQVELTDTRNIGAVSSISTSSLADAGRAWHSSYFEMLGEQGWPGLILFLLIQFIALISMERIRRRYRRDETMAWAASLATALQSFQIIYMVGSAFVQTAFQPFGWMTMSVQIGFAQWLAIRERQARKVGWGNRNAAAEPVTVQG